MTSWDNSDIDREASELARVFWAGQGQNGANLGELATKLARDNALNEEQIRRLCRAANAKAFEQKHASMTGDVRSPTWELADEEGVISQLNQAAATSFSKQAAATYPELEDELRPQYRPTLQASTRSKVASMVAVAETYAEPTRAPLIEFNRCARELEEQRAEKIAHDFVWSDAVNQLIRNSQLMNWDHDAFEKNAVALFGGDVLPELDLLRRHTGRPQLATDDTLHDVTAKLAELSDDLVGTPDDNSKQLGLALTARRAYEDAGTKIAQLTRKHAELRKVLRHAR